MEIIKIKDKKIHNYTTAVRQGIANDGTVKILARGDRYNAKAINVALIISRELNVDRDVYICNETFKNNGETVYVSAVEITLKS